MHESIQVLKKQNIKGVFGDERKKGRTFSMRAKHFLRDARRINLELCPYV